MADGSFKVNGVEYNLPSDLSMGEMCDCEQHFGVEFGNAASSGVRMAAALIYIAVRRKDPTVTPEDIRELPMDVFEGMGDVSPPDGSNSGSSETSGRSGSGDGASQDGSPEPTGPLSSDTRSASVLATSRS